MPLPAQLESAIATSVDLLAKKLRCETHEAKTHRALAIQGWAEPDVVVQVGAYLVGLLAAAISRTLEIRAAIEDTEADKLELRTSVDLIVGTSASPLTTDQKEDERNPWIAEGLWHLCFFLAGKRPDLHPLGAIVALDFPHVSAKDHGLDVMAIYRSPAGFGASFVESKAYANNPNKAINHAVSFFQKLDRGDHDTRIRQVVASMRQGMSAELQEEVSPSLWKHLRAYVPNPHYDDGVSIDWSNTRSSFKELLVPPERILVMPHAVPKFAQFFDDVAQAMSAFVCTL